MYNWHNKGAWTMLFYILSANTFPGALQLISIASGHPLLYISKKISVVEMLM
jgi:hypothetical protein